MEAKRRRDGARRVAALKEFMVASFEAGVPVGSYPVATHDGKWPGTIVTCLSRLKNYYTAAGAKSSPPAAWRECWLGVLRHATQFYST